ncbi:DUF1571 domain-containing protein [Stieleria sp.]|uniref:DUF1571 domain-containing protein n=1 Tax=Stieleria sp. TaxID=2795976 RepID=UPI003567A556
MAPSKSRRGWVLLIPALLVGTVAFASVMRSKPDVRQDVAPTIMQEPADDATDQTPRPRQSSIAEVLELADRALASMDDSLEDYTARFIKQDRSESGVLNERSEMEVKIQTRHRNETNDAPIRIYLKFLAPEAAAGREVIWGKDLYDGQMAVHEVTVLLSWKTLWLDPTGMLAMAGQRYPIYEIGITGLVEKLIERGQKDLDNPDVTVTITRDHEFDSRMCDLIKAQRSQPGGGEDDFSLAEIVYDPERLLILSYRSFGWPDPDAPDDQLPLVESYEYRDLKTNVGLTDKDFDITNESYTFP